VNDNSEVDYFNVADLFAVLIEFHPANLSLAFVIDEKHAVGSRHARNTGSVKRAPDKGRHSLDGLRA
jgi:hypothetical protein